MVCSRTVRVPGPGPWPAQAAVCGVASAPPGTGAVSTPRGHLTTDHHHHQPHIFMSGLLAGQAGPRAPSTRSSALALEFENNLVNIRY